MSNLSSTESFNHLDFHVVPLEDLLRAPKPIEEQKKEAPRAPNTAAKALVVLDNILDFVPVGSTASNLVNLGLKHLVFRDVEPSRSEYTEYVQHLKEKQSTTCLLYGLPLIGNVAKLGVGITKLVVSTVSGGAQDPKIDLAATREALKTHPILDGLSKEEDTDFKNVTI